MIPDFQTLMLPLMQIAGDQHEHSSSEVLTTLAQRFRLTEDEQRTFLPSGRQTRFTNRTAWARVYLGKAGLLETTGRGRFRITQRGLEVLRQNPERINTTFLMRFPEFVEFQQRSRQPNAPTHEPEETAQTPEEALETSYQAVRNAVAQDLLTRARAMAPSRFEALVVDLLVAIGYGGSRRDAGQAVGQSGDDGIDGIIKEDALGLDVVYIQAKRWQQSVGRPVLQAFAGSLEGQRANKGIFLTTSYFTQDAKDYVTRIQKKIVLIDGEQLAQLMIDYGIGVTEVARYTIKKIDLDYFSDTP